MQSADYFINNGDQTVDDGYWEPHTSSIDFCETNYLHSSYIAEPHNLFSSLWGLSLLGLIGIYYGNPTGEIRFKIAYGILILIGIGSAALHGTLNWVFQSADELPMIYLVISALYCLIELGDDDDVTVPIPSPSQQKYNNNNNNNNSNNNNKVLKYPWLQHIFVVLGIINTLIYFRFQQIYIVFLLTFIVMIIAAFILHVQIAWRQRQIIILSLSTTFPSTDEVDETTTSNNSNYNRNNNNSNMTVNIIRRNNAQIALRFYVWHYVVFVGIATPVWILDQFWCKNLLPTYNSLPYFLRGCTLHVIWHVMAGLGGYTILQFLVTCRMSVLGLPCKIQWILGIIPVVVSAVPSGYNENTKQL